MELKTYFAQDAAGNIISSAIVNVFLQGTTTLATGLTRADGTPLENPFAADGAGRIQFRAPDGYYDVQVSAGPGIIQTLTIQCVDYSGAKADADRAEAAADLADVSAEQAQNALNSITGINTNFERNSREQWRRSLAEAGLKLVSGSFEEGATANSSTDAVWHIAGGQCYAWDGAFPKTVPAGSTPASTGGEGAGKWKELLNYDLTQQIMVSLRRSYAEAGINLVDGSFARGGTVSTATDVLLNEVDGKVYSWGGILPKTVPSGSSPETTGGFGVTAWNAMPENGKREIAHLEDYLPDLLGITDYSDIVQRVVDTSNIVLFGKGRCKISSVAWPTRATVIGVGNDSVFVVSDDVDVFKLPAGGRFSNFAIEVTNPNYTKDIFKVATSYLMATSTGREDDDRTETRNITIRATSIPINSAGLNCNTIKLLADANGKGLYKHVFDNIDIHRGGRPVDIETTGVDAWVNSNTISGCYAFATNGVVKMRNNGTNSEIRDNTVEVNLQNDINFPGVMVYDIPTSYSIKDNKISGYIWDVIPDQTAPGGCKFGNAGLNIVYSPMTSSNSFGGNYLYIGSLSDSEGIAFVDFSISRYAQSVDTLKIAVVAGVPSIRYHNTDQSLGLDFRYQKIGDIIYLFMKTDVVYLDVTVTNSACFTPGSHTSALASVPNSEAMPLPATRKPVTASSTGFITGFNFLLSMTDRLEVSELTDINQIPIGGNNRGLTAFTCAGTAIGLDTDNQVGCLFFDKGNISGANNYGSNIIAFSQGGDILIRTYQNGWGGWKKVTMTDYP